MFVTQLLSDINKTSINNIIRNINHLVEDIYSIYFPA